MNDRNPGRSRKRNRSRGRGSNSAANKPSGKAGKSAARKSQPKVDPVEFWGDPEMLPEQVADVQHSADVRAVLTSLGRPPLTGNETAAEHWFSMVYERAAFLAGALAAAGDLVAESSDES